MPRWRSRSMCLPAQSPPSTVKVWGTRNFDPKPDYVSDLVVSEILPEGDVAQPAPQPTRVSSSGTPAAPDITAVVNFSLVNLYNTPSQSMSVVGQARAGERCNLQGRDATGHLAAGGLWWNGRLDRPPAGQCHRQPASCAGDKSRGCAKAAACTAAAYADAATDHAAGHISGLEGIVLQQSYAKRIAGCLSRYADGRLQLGLWFASRRPCR